MRTTRISRSVRAGCFSCHGNEAHWTQKNAQGVAAQHHDKTGHETWVEVSMSIYYGTSDAPKNQTGFDGM